MLLIHLTIYTIIILALISFLLVFIYFLYEYYMFRKEFKKDDHVIFWFGNKRQSGKILKIKSRKAIVRNFFDKKTYSLPHYKISKL